MVVDVVSSKVLLHRLETTGEHNVSAGRPLERA